MFLTSAQTEALYYNKADTNNLLANKVFNIGDISLPGMLDIGTSNYTNSRIRCNANLGGYTGYAELKAASSYGMFVNLSTTRADGGWVYFKIDNDDFIQLSGNGDKVNIYKDTPVSGHLDVGSGVSSKINVHAANNGYIGYGELYAQSSCDLYINRQTTRVNGGWVCHTINGGRFLLLSGSGQIVKNFKPLVSSSDDRLEENEELIEHACETLSKLRPQLYAKNQILTMMTIQPGIKKVV